MEFFSNLAVLVVPRWVKAAVVFILAALAFLYVGLSIIGVLDQSRPGWIVAGTYILGVLVPILLLVMVIGYAQTGVDALTAKTSEYLTRTIPGRAILLKDPDSGFKSAASYPKRLPKTKAPVVRVQASANMSVANYIIEAAPINLSKLSTEPARILLIRVELNATKINVNIMFHPDLLKKLHLENNGEYDVKRLFPHTINGSQQEGYWFNEELVTRVFFGTEYKALVTARRLSEDFLVSPIKKLDLAQDLMFMLRSVLNERPELFELAADFKGRKK